MEHILQLRPVHLVELIRSDNLHIREQIGCVQLGVRYPPRNISARDSDLVDEVPLRRDLGMIGLAPEDIHSPAQQVVFFGMRSKKGPCIWLRDSATGFILVERVLKRTDEEVALGAIAIDHPQSCI